MSRGPQKTWTPEEVERLTAGFTLGGVPGALVALKGERSRSSIIGKAAALNLIAPGRWTPEEEAYATERQAEGASVVDIALELARSERSVAQKLLRMAQGSTRREVTHQPRKGPRQSWTSEEDEFLRNNYATLGLDEAAKALPHRTRSAVAIRASDLKLTRPKPVHGTARTGDAVFAATNVPRSMAILERVAKGDRSPHAPAPDGGLTDGYF